jgi:hypothetical protein
MASYPSINSDKLLPFKLVRQRLLDDPNYLDASDCPYGPDVKQWLRAAFLPEEQVAMPVATVIEDVNIEDEALWSDVASQARQLYRELESVKDTVGKGDTSELISITKAQAGLLERLISVGEKAIGLREMAEFKRVILSAIDDLMTPDARTTLMARLGD